ncbi:hypothetical protein BDV29DRAFT_87600 [Aspergillus leporis]|uniref:Uncharacterized protein n=1 Tax=Aspergillus leporis TaxID=41062 RepID=A0A5N5X6S7_9EURO|nr:hypothetical protein BDV29DRAFT_87600 [Aspergillus leporis]
MKTDLVRYSTVLMEIIFLFIYFYLSYLLTCSVAASASNETMPVSGCNPTSPSTLFFCLPTSFTRISIFGGNWCLASSACSRFV